MATVRELVTKIGFKVDQNALKRANQSFRSLGKLALGASAAVAGIATGLSAIVKSTANTGDFFAKTSQQVGVSIKGLQRLAFAAKLGGSNTQDLANAFRVLSKNTVAAADGEKTYLELFQKLKLDPKKFLGNNEGLLMAIADRFANLKDEQLKTSIAQELLGRAGTKLIPTLNSGSKAIQALGDRAEKLGLVLSDKVAKSSEVFNDNISQLWDSLTGIKNIIGSVLIPILKKVTGRALEWVLANSKLIKSKVTYFVERLVKAVRELIPKLKFVFGMIKKLIDRFGGLEKILKNVALIFALFVGGKILFGLYNISIAIASIITALRTMKLAAIAGQAALGALWILIVAFAIALGVLVGYIIKRWKKVKEAFVDAAKTVVGEWYNAFAALFNYLKVKFIETAKIAKGLLNPFTVKETIGKIKSGEAFANSQAALKRLQQASGLIQKRGFWGADPKTAFFQEFFKNLKPTLSNDYETAKGMLGMGGPNTTNNSKTVHQHNHIKVEATDPSFIESKLASWTDRLLRSANQATNTSGI